MIRFFHLAVLIAASCCAADLRIAAFRADATPPQGKPLIWTTPAAVVRDPLLAKGVIIQDGKERYVLCSLDWCGVGNRTHAMFRRKLAEAVGARAGRVALQSVHQHTAPYIDASAYLLLRKQGVSVLEFDEASLDAIASKLAAAAREAAARLEPFDSIGTSSAVVRQVASARRLKDPSGKIVVRFSTSAKDPKMAEAPEGAIDPELKTITFARGSKPLVRLHYYATHPQTFCCEGTVTSDVVGLAREAVERAEGVPQIYFTGCAGDVTMGKYNDGSKEAQERIVARLQAAMRSSNSAARFERAAEIAWSSAPLALPKRKEQRVYPSRPDNSDKYILAIGAVFQQRAEPLEISALRMGRVHVVHLPGEPMLEFQRHAQSLRNGEFVAVAGYGDIAPGYICTDAAYAEGGYEPSASNTGPGAEAAVKAVLKKLLGPKGR